MEEEQPSSNENDDHELDEELSLHSLRLGGGLSMAWGGKVNASGSCCSSAGDTVEYCCSSTTAMLLHI